MVFWGREKKKGAQQLRETFLVRRGVFGSLVLLSKKTEVPQPGFKAPVYFRGSHGARAGLERVASPVLPGQASRSSPAWGRKEGGRPQIGTWMPLQVLSVAIAPQKHPHPNLQARKASQATWLAFLLLGSSKQRASSAASRSLRRL